MSVLPSFPDEMRVAVIGATGGIGTALVERLAAAGNVSQVFAFARNFDTQSNDKVYLAPIDITRERSVRDAASIASLDGELDLVLVTTGILHDGNDVRPEKSLRDIDARAMMNVLRVNTVGPALVGKHFLPHMRRSGKSVFAALSARVGSIGDNRLGGWVSYRASKAALNMTLKTLAIEHSRRFPDSVILGLHPGTVDTQLSRPFQRNVPEGKLFSTARSAGHLLDVIDAATPTDSGRVFAWDGSVIEH